jgi:hypothetical protein
MLCAALAACNKEKRLMKGLVGNWTIEKSERAVIYSDGSEDMYEDRSDVGEIVISDGATDETKNFTFWYVEPDGDTMRFASTLSTDEKNKRLVFEKVLSDSTVYSDVIWTIDKSKKNKQVWSAYGVDTTFYYPTNKFNPGSANNWLMWRITLKRQNSQGWSGS